LTIEAVNIALQRCAVAKFGPLQSLPINGVTGAARPEGTIDE
jgi:hypothetical protein